MSTRIALLALATLVGGPGCGTPAPGPLARVGQQIIPALPAAPEARIERPWFDASGRLLLETAPVSRPGDGACAGGAAVERRVTHLLSPRVDEVVCVQPGAAEPRMRQAALLGVEAAGRITWRRALGFRSGRYTFDQRVLGATPEGIVLSDLTVVSARDGATVREPPTHPIAGESRTVPDQQLTGAAIYLPVRRAFVAFSADVTLVRHQGGLSLLDPRSGGQDLVLPVAATLLGGWWQVEALAVAGDERYVLMGERLAVRGPGDVRLRVLDLQERRVVYSETLAHGVYSRSPALTVDGRNIGFAFLDETAGRWVLTAYRLPPGPSPR